MKLRPILQVLLLACRFRLPARERRILSFPLQRNTAFSGAVNFSRSLRRTKTLLAWQRWLLGLGVFFILIALSFEINISAVGFGIITSASTLIRIRLLW